MPAEIWVLAENWRGKLTDSTFEVLALGRELADALGTTLCAVLMGQQCQKLAAELGAADQVFCIEDAKLAEPVADTQCQALVSLVTQRKPRALLIPLTNATLDLATLLPPRLEAPFLNWCRNVFAEEGQLRAKCVLYGGKMEATVAPAAEFAIFGILPGARTAQAGRVERAPKIEEVVVPLEAPKQVRFQGFIEPEAGDVDITQVPILVAVGRGIQTQDNIALAQEVAEALGGAVCGSRPVIDQGWLPLSRQVGKSGVTVKPKLYLAVGISGAPEHVEGMKGSELIIAINNDPQAPIFQVAHYGVVADALEFLPILVEETRKVHSAKGS